MSENHHHHHHHHRKRKNVIHRLKKINYISLGLFLLALVLLTTLYFYASEVIVSLNGLYVESEPDDNTVNTIQYKNGAEGSDVIVPDETQVLFNKIGNTLQIRTSFGVDSVMAQKLSLEDGNNFVVNFSGIFVASPNYGADVIVDGTVLKDTTDDITPLKFNIGHVGANHGWSNMSLIVTFNEIHELTGSDIGSVWEDYNGSHFVLKSIINEYTLEFISEYTGDEFFPLSSDLPFEYMTWVSGANPREKMNISAAENQNLYNTVNREEVKVLINGIDEYDMTQNGHALGSFVDVVDKYYIFDIPSAIETLKKTGIWGGDDITDYYCSVSEKYRYAPNGSCTVYSDIEFTKSVRWMNTGTVQSYKISDDQKLYIPGVPAYSTPTSYKDSFYLNMSDWSDNTKPPYRFYQFNPENSAAFCVGYNTEYGNAVPSERLMHTTQAAYCPNTQKIYPYIITEKFESDPDYKISTVSYRIPFVRKDDDLTAMCWYWVGDDIYLMIDANKDVNKVITLPSYMNGRTINQIDVTASCLIPQTTVTDSSLQFTVTGGYGYAVLKLTP